MGESPKKNDRGRYVNPHIGDLKRKPKDFILWMLGFFRDIPYEEVPEGFSYPSSEPEFQVENPWAMWIGHSTYLLSVGGKNFLTDPIWGKRCSPVPLLGPKRLTPPPIQIDHLPQIHYVMISHDHYDHLDRSSVEKLHARFPEILWIVPTGVGSWFQKLGIQRIVELDWWQEVDVDSSFKITAVPAQHFSGRQSTEVNRTLWAGYVVESILQSKAFYFVGDTGYNTVHFKEIGRQFPNIDLSLIPIGSYSPRRFMASVHIEPRDAVNIHLDVNSQLSLGMHWKTYRLSEEPINQPPYDLFLSMRENGLDPATFLPIEPGYKINW